MAFTAVGALVAGETAVTATMVLSAVAEVGMAMTVVGAVTGSKDLMKIGGVLGLVGGVGSMISGGLSAAGAGAASTELAGDTLSKAALDGTTSFGANSVEGALDLGGATSSAVSTASATGTTLPDLGAAMPNPGDMRLAAGTQTTPGVVDAAMQPNAGAATVNDVASPGGVQGPQGPAGAQAPKTPWEADFQGTSALTSPNPGVTAGAVNAPQTAGNFWKSFSDFANNNKTLFSSGMQLVGGAMSGANQRDMWNQKMALDQQRVNQTSYGNQVGNFAPGTGVINGARTA